MSKRWLYGLWLVASVSTTAWADQGAVGRLPGPPPQEAIDACNGKAEGDQVEFTVPDGKTIKGVCRLLHEQMAAVPAGRLPGMEGQGKMPPPSEVK